MSDIFWVARWRQHKLGFERSTILVHGEPYMTRYIAHFALFSLRVHRFHTGDGDRSQHNHPFAFVTFPLASYLEDTELFGQREVKRYSLHFRSREFRHRVIGQIHNKPFWTLVISGPYSEGWGFYNEAGEYTTWRDWK